MVFFVGLLVRSIVVILGGVYFPPVGTRDGSLFVVDSKAKIDRCWNVQLVFPVVSAIYGSPRETIKVKVNCVVVSFWILSKIAKVNCSIWIVMGVPEGILQESLGDVSLPTSLQ